MDDHCSDGGKKGLRIHVVPRVGETFFFKSFFLPREGFTFGDFFGGGGTPLRQSGGVDSGRVGGGACVRA